MTVEKIEPALTWLTFVILGALAGYMIGVSTAPVIGAIVPIVLGACLAVLLKHEKPSSRGEEWRARCQGGPLFSEAAEPDQLHFVLSRHSLESDSPGNPAPSRLILVVGILLFGVFTFLGTSLGVGERSSSFWAEYEPPQPPQYDENSPPLSNTGDPDKNEEQILPIKNMDQRWRIYLTSLRLNLSKAAHDALQDYAKAEAHFNAGQWANFETWLQEFAQGGPLGDPITTAPHALGPPRKKNSQDDPTEE